jgi:hypothetical protein
MAAPGRASGSRGLPFENWSAQVEMNDITLEIAPETAENELQVPEPHNRANASPDPDLLERLMRIEVRAEVVYAFRKVGVLVTSLNRDRLDPAIIAAWDAAIAQYIRAESRHTVNRDNVDSEKAQDLDEEY